MTIECTDVTKNFGELSVVDRVSFNVAAGDFVTILGPSGCGKSTFLSLVAGLETISSGSINVLGEPVTKPSRKFGFVFQDYALFPWKTVLGNVMAGLNEGTKAERRDAAMYYVEKVGLTDFAHAYPYTLSGGMKQRVGIARALAYEPPILLMDEPFGALDAQTRKFMQQELKNILEGFNKTVLFVTHSVIEAVYLGTRAVVFSKRPSRIVFEEEIDLGSDRHYTDPEYLRYREEILHYLDKETGVHE